MINQQVSRQNAVNIQNKMINNKISNYSAKSTQIQGS
jgi:hypothetical protein